MIRSPLTTVAALLATTLVAVVLCFAQDAAKDKPREQKETVEQKLVRAYLKENLPSGKFEEVRWWIARDFRNGKRSIRLKYRTTNAVGGIDLFDDAFYFKAGKIVEWHKNEGKLFHGYDEEKPSK